MEDQTAKLEDLTQPFLEPTPRPIVRPLPPDDAAVAGGAHHDPADILRATVFGADHNWFDAHWCGKLSGAWQLLPGTLLGGLRDMIEAAQSSRLDMGGGLKVPLRGILASLSPHGPDLRPSPQ